MEQKVDITFIWEGISNDEIRGSWDDGLAKAMEFLEEDYDIEYKEPWEDFSGNILLYWESPLTYNSSEYYKQIQNDPRPKALLFAGGAIEPEPIEGFDLFFTESQINDDEFEALGKDHIRAFGVNTDVFTPLDVGKKYEGAMHATFAGWKRHELFADALGEDGLAFGQIQEHDKNGYNACKDAGVTVYGEKTRQEANRLIQTAHVLVNTADFWGGGQRTTLEAMAAGLPVVVMKDSPKNREYVEESGAGVVCDPDPQSIQEAIEEAKQIDGTVGREYVESQWTPQHYADNLQEGIEQLL